MNRAETIIVLGILKTSFPRFYASMKKDEAESTIALWQTMFAGDDVECVQLALYKLISTCEFPPTIAEMRKALSSVTDKELPTDGEAWGEVTRAIRKYGYMQGEEALKSMSPLTAKAVRCMGWVTICQSEDTMADRAHFLKIYNQLERRERETLQIPLVIQEKIRLSIETNKPQEQNQEQKITLLPEQKPTQVSECVLIMLEDALNKLKFQEG